MSIQVAILKVLASHGNGRATLDSLRRDITILTASGSDWSARLKRLAGRVLSIDIFGSGYVLHDREGWEITAEGREFLCTLEAITQDNQAVEAEPQVVQLPEIAERPPRSTHRGRPSLQEPPSRPARRGVGGISTPGKAAREESASKKK